MAFTSEGGVKPHDLALLEMLSARVEELFTGECFRAARATADPTAFSPNGGRWAPPSTYQAVPVLYTSLTREGALAEVASYLALLNPPPSKRIVVHSLRVTARKVVRLASNDLNPLGVNQGSYGERNYARPGEAPPSRTQEIGAALSFLGFDGLIAPSARWRCDNLILFGDNHNLACDLESTGREEVDWQAWMKEFELQII